MKRILACVLLLSLLSACAPSPAQAPTPSVPEQLLAAAPFAAYGAQMARENGELYQFPPFADEASLAFSGGIPLYTLLEGQLLPDEQTLFLLLADGGVVGEASWPPAPLEGISLSSLAEARLAITFYTEQSFDPGGTQGVELLNAALTAGEPIAFARTGGQLWLLRAKDATLLRGTPEDPEGFPDEKAARAAAKKLPLTTISQAQPFPIATWEQYRYEFTPFPTQDEDLPLAEQIERELLQALVSTPAPTDEMYLTQPIPVYVARDGEIHAEPVVLRPIFSGATCIGYARIYNERLQQLRLFDPQHPNALATGLTDALAKGLGVALLTEKKNAYLLADDHARSIASHAPQADMDGLGNRQQVEAAAAGLALAALIRAEDLAFSLPIPAQQDDPMGRAVTLHLLLRSRQTGEAAQIQGLSHGETIPLYTYGADEQLAPSETQLVPIFRDQTLLGAMWWNSWNGNSLSSGVLWAEDAPAFIAALAQAAAAATPCCLIDDAQQRWLICGGEATVATRFPVFDQFRACFESAEIAAIAAQHLEKAVPAPAHPLAQ